MEANSNNIIHFLKKFGDLNSTAIQAIERKLSILELPKKTLLLKTGNVCHHLYYIEKGLARNYSEDQNKIYTNDLVLEGELLVSFSSFVSRKPSLENIELLEDCTLNALHYDDLQQLYLDFPELEHIGRKIAEYHYNSLAVKTYQLRFYSSAQRYQYLFDHKIEIIKRAPLGVIASYLGMTIENLSRIRNK